MQQQSCWILRMDYVPSSPALVLAEGDGGGGGAEKKLQQTPMAMTMTTSRY